MQIPYPAGMSRPTCSPLQLNRPPECLTIDLDGLNFVGSTQRGAHYAIEAWAGWWNGSSADGGPIAYGTADGGYQTPVRMTGRSITLQGNIEATGRQELWRMIDALGSILASNRWAPMIVSELALASRRQIDVCRLREPMIDVTGWTSADFTLELQSATFPRLDADLSSVTINPGSTGTLVNAGDYPADMIVSLVGPLTNPVLLWQGDTASSWAWTGTVASGQTLQVRLTPRIVRDPATSAHYTNTAYGNWPQLQPGTSTLKLTATGSGKAIVEWRSAWT